jgi:hypothetical protein
MYVCVSVCLRKLAEASDVCVLLASSFLCARTHKCLRLGACIYIYIYILWSKLGWILMQVDHVHVCMSVFMYVCVCLSV